MVSALTKQTFDALEKDYYTQDRVFNLTYENRPFFAMLRKDTNFGGRRTPTPLIYGNSQARSASFAQAKARSIDSAAKSESFYITETKDYSFATVDNFTIESTKSDKHAFASAMKVAMDSAQASLANSIASGLFRDQSGYIGQVAAPPAAAANMKLTLKYGSSDSVSFSLDQEIEIFTAKSGGTAKTSNGTLNTFKIIAIDRSTGEITFEQPSTAGTTIAANDFLFIKGDRGAKLAGLESWLPFDRPTSGDNFFQVDRSKDPTRLAGVIHDGVGENMEQALIKLAHKVAREGGGKPDYAWVSYESLKDLILVLGSKVQYVDVNVPYVKAGFRGVEILGPTGAIRVMADPWMGDKFAYMTSMDTWVLRSVGDAVGLSRTDGNEALRQSDADGIEIRYRSYLNLACLAPGHNGVVKLKN